MSRRTQGRPSGTAHVDPAYSLEIVVSDDRVDDVARIVAATPDPVESRELDHPEGGWARLVLTTDGEHSLGTLQSRLREILDVHLVYCEDRALALSRGGKTQLRATVPLDTAEDLALAYTPGVGRVAQRIAGNPATVDELTGRANRVAVVTDGSAVLGLGNLGPLAALPVMEAKAALFAHLAGIDAVPICLATQDVDEIVAAVTAIAPSFGGINLEDIAAPRCFAIEERLRDSLNIPVVHDDQHGTATVVLAAMLNALRVVDKSLESARIVVTGAGAAGTAVTRLLLAAGAHDVVVWAPVGVLHPSLADVLPPHKRWLVRHTNPRGVHGGLEAALTGADAVIGVSAPGVLNYALISKMAVNPIVFALANPVPEVDPDEVMDLVSVIATGRSDYPNQVNNALVFPGLFRGALGTSATALNEDVFVACANALAALTTPPHPEQLLPDVLDPRVVPAVADAVTRTLTQTDPRLSHHGALQRDDVDTQNELHSGKEEGDG